MTERMVDWVSSALKPVVRQSLTKASVQASPARKTRAPMTSPNSTLVCFRAWVTHCGSRTIPATTAIHLTSSAK
jgi:hypothetical protein